MPAAARRQVQHRPEFSLNAQMAVDLRMRSKS